MNHSRRRMRVGRKLPRLTAWRRTSSGGRNRNRFGGGDRGQVGRGHAIRGGVFGASQAVRVRAGADASRLADHRRVRGASGVSRASAGVSQRGSGGSGLVAAWRVRLRDRGARGVRRLADHRWCTSSACRSIKRVRCCKSSTGYRSGSMTAGVAVAQLPYFIWVSIATDLQLSITATNWGHCNWRSSVGRAPVVLDRVRRSWAVK